MASDLYEKDQTQAEPDLHDTLSKNPEDEDAAEPKSVENLEEITSKNLQTKKNIQKKTLESEDFHQLVKNKIQKVKGKIILSNQ